ncbi:MAG TPA: hypothetical protein VKY73_12015 [Polyangiaceae bacterium]|nr:hypothetical protein [Polyangiaceae bacterium]
MLARSAVMGLVVLGASFIAHPAWSQEETETGSGSEEVSEEEPESDPEADPASDGDTASAEETEGGAGDEDALVADIERGASPVEVSGQTYLFVGARYRFILVPQFIMGMFADGGTTVGVHSGGAEFIVRRNDFEYNFALWLAGYSMDPTPFKAKSDGEDAWELVESRMKVLYLTADFLWSQNLSPELAINYGMGAGFGLVFGPLYRNQAYRAADGSYQPCIGQLNPNPFYCGQDNDHYNNYEEPSWTKGSKPVVFPWLALQTGVRYKPHRNFVARFDAGFGLSGFFFGVGADYGL